MKTGKLLSTMILALATSGALLGANAVDLLRQSEAADRHVTYRGMKLVNVSHGGTTSASTLKVVHLLPDKTRTEYFSPAALAGVIVIEDGPTVWKFIPSENAWEQARYRSPLPSREIHRRALENYDIEMAGTDQVAGRPTYVIHAVPRGMGETAHRLWIDRDCYLTVRTDVENLHGAVLSSARYTQIQINPPDISPASFKITGKIKPKPKPSCTRFTAVKPTYLPKGYRLIGVGSMSVNCRSCVHLQFSNGVNSLSLFEHQTDKDAPLKRTASKVGNVLTWARRGVLFTLIGDVPSVELQKIADSTK